MMLNEIQHINLYDLHSAYAGDYHEFVKRQGILKDDLHEDTNIMPIHETIYNHCTANYLHAP